ncbi:hypothetical protein K443DRAFT_92437, partial [Laccaria amethystina LaAM-08-1]
LMFLLFISLIINVFGMHISFIILQVSTIMEVPLPGSQIGPCLKCKWRKCVGQMGSWSMLRCEFYHQFMTKHC